MVPQLYVKNTAVSMHQVGSLICNLYNKLMVKNDNSPFTVIIETCIGAQVTYQENSNYLMNPAPKSYHFE